MKAAIEGVSGFQVAGVHAGLKKDGLLDFALIVSDRPCQAAGVFTKNEVKAACVLADMKKLAENPDHIRAVAINTRCANACTGQQGIENADKMAHYTAEQLGCDAESVLVLSTGVIGTQLPMDTIKHGIDLATGNLGNDWEATARGIMTTDTRPKYASVKVQTAAGETYHIAGISKGAGMIAPNMATMLGIIVTDAGCAQPQLQHALQTAAEVSYNRIVVDGDMSTNDTVFLLANGASGVTLETEADRAQFQDALEALCVKLAQDIVRDGEGVTKFVTIKITGAPDDDAARVIANTIATSPLVKTAFYGNDANWGRIVAAAGRAGISLNQSCLKLWFSLTEDAPNPLQLIDNGLPLNYSEAEATSIVNEPAFAVLLDCGAGSGSALVWTCDLSHDYVSINGDYRS
ncbi:MAG: bifunctional glutamate N-acetyltransferase/amino-acid acetyltransferase ArgJ [Anaerolineae bacterium]|nr:bifunctional glutamate N-acetyltransferase/amino-acid acetyltransferase ArgJ [Anaerolineae bacterium]